MSCEGPKRAPKNKKSDKVRSFQEDQEDDSQEAYS